MDIKEAKQLLQQCFHTLERINEEFCSNLPYKFNEFIEQEGFEEYLKDAINGSYSCMSTLEEMEHLNEE